MNKKTLLLITGVCLLTLNSVFAQSTQFTYQGLLNTNGAPFSGSAEFQFTLWDAASNGNAIATNNPTSVIANVANGLFTVTLDFGINPFNGDARFLQTDVRTTIGLFTTLAPRQPLTATPYALRALNLTTNGLVSGTYGNALTFNNVGNSFAGAFNGSFTGAYTGSGANLTNVNATTLGGVPATGYWKTNGNSGANPTNGAFLGTTDNLPLEIKVNGQRGLRLEPATFGPNVIGGDSGNSMEAGVSGSTIGGGGANRILLSIDVATTGFSVIGGGSDNLIGGTPGSGTIAFGGCNFIGGGIQNVIRVGGDFDTITGGDHNIIDTNADTATIGGGGQNFIGNNSLGSAIAGGINNRIGFNSFAGVIGGGNNNTITNNANFGMIPGGDLNTATNNAFAAGHRAKAIHRGAFVWADPQNADFTSTATNQFLIRASGGVGINTANPSRDLEIQNSGAVEIGIKSTDSGGHLWTLQSSSITGSANLDASFQIIDRTLNSARLLIQTNGNVGIGTSAPTNRLHVNGGITCTALVQTSDRNAKENFAFVSPEEVLAKVAGLPISTWNFKEMRDGRHLGPMAQDFYAAFQLGGSETTITAVDTEGVALAAIQGLNQKLRREVENKDVEIAELKERMRKIEGALEKIVGRSNE